MKKKISIPNAVKQLLRIVDRLCKTFPQKKFTLDGRLVGDIGEVLVADAYDISLYENLRKHHDGKTSDGRLVQIKATMKSSLTFPADHKPDYYLGIKIHADGSFTEIFNGPGVLAAQAVKNRELTKTNLHSVSISALQALNAMVKTKERIKRRTNSRILSAPSA